MMRALFAGVSGLRNHQTRMDVIGNNIANVNTVGFKGSRVTFKEAFFQMLSGASRSQQDQGGLNPMEIGTGVNLGSIDTLFTQGSLETTGQPLDLAIQGYGPVRARQRLAAVLHARRGLPARRRRPHGLAQLGLRGAGHHGRRATATSRPPRRSATSRSSSASARRRSRPRRSRCSATSTTARRSATRTRWASRCTTRRRGSHQLRMLVHQDRARAPGPGRPRWTGRPCPARPPAP